MSFIHSIKHDAPGNIAGIVPIYLPLQEVTGDFTASPGHMLLGGGGGELDAYVLHPNETATIALDSFFMPSGWELDPQVKTLLSKAGITEDDYYTFHDDQLLPQEEPPMDTWPAWTGDEWYYIVSAAMNHGYQHTNYRGITQWLLVNAGAWVLRNRPDLLDLSRLDDKGKRIYQIGLYLLNRDGKHLGNLIPDPVY